MVDCPSGWRCPEKYHHCAISYPLDNLYLCPEINLNKKLYVRRDNQRESAQCKPYKDSGENSYIRNDH
jgi:hypothetical protein